MQRKSYLIKQAVRTYVIASVLTTAVGQLNGLIDSVILGNLIGPEALSAVALSLPVITLSSLVYVLFGSGASILAGKAIGERDWERASRIFTISMGVLFIVGILVGIVSWYMSDRITAIICDDESLSSYVHEYIRWMLGLCVFTVFSQSLALFTEMDGHPKTVAYAMLITMVLNTVFDIVLVSACGLGVAGSAISSAISCAAAALFLVGHTVRTPHSYRLKWRRGGNLRLLIDSIKNSTMMMVMTLLAALMTIVLNRVVMTHLGADGMFMLSVVMSMMSIGLLLGQGISQAYLAVGSMLYGQQDDMGLKMLFRRCLMLILIVGALMTIIGQTMPALLARMFGAKTVELIAITESSLRMATMAFIPFLTLVLLPSLYQVQGHIRLAATPLALFYTLLIITIQLFGISSYAEYLWLAFPISSLIALPVMLLCPSPLTPNRAPLTVIMDISVPARQEAVTQVLEEVHRLLRRNEIEVCIEELLVNIVCYAGLRADQFIDLRIAQTENEYLVTLKDNGKAFDPVAYHNSHENLGLTLAKGLSTKMEYKFMYGQNMCFLHFFAETKSSV